MLKRLTYFFVVLSLLLGASCSSNPNTTEPIANATQEQLTPASQTVADATVEPTQEPSATATAIPTEKATNTPMPPTATSLPTSTLTPTSTPEPTQEAPSASVILAQAAVGSTNTVERVETIEMILVGDKGDPSPETKQYTLAYDENGMIIARFSAENGDENQWIAGGPFANKEINAGYSNFPCSTNAFGFCGVQVWVSSLVSYGLYTDGTAIQLLDRQGNPTPFYMEAGVIGYYLDVHGEQQEIMIPIMISNEAGQRVITSDFSETPLPEWSFSDLMTKINHTYFYTHWDNTLYDDPQEISYWSNENAVMPTLGFGDVVLMAFPVPGRSTSGDKELAEAFAFLQPLISHYYFSNSYNEFLNTGDVSLLEDAAISFMKINGIPLVIPSTGIIWNLDVYR